MSDADEFDPDGVEEREIAAEAAHDTDDFLSLIPHYYRGEVSQMTAGRERVGQATDWAIALLAAVLTLTFSSPGIPPYVLLIGIVGMCTFLAFEARRYRSFDRSRARVRLLEENVFANAFNPTGVEHVDWREEIEEDLRRPTFKITYREALSHRIRRVYGLLLALLGVGWVFKITMFTPTGTWRHAAALPNLPGTVVIAAVALFYLAVATLAYWPAPRQAMGEVYGEEIGEWKRRK